MTENEFRRIRSHQPVRVARGRAQTSGGRFDSRIGACGIAQFATALERSSDGAASAAARPAGVRRGGSASGGGRGVNIGPSNCQTSMSIVKTRCSLIQFNHNGTYIWMQHGQVFITPIVQESWIKTLTENKLGRSRLRGWPAAGPRRAEEVSRIAACGTVRVAAGPDREGIGPGDHCQLPNRTGRRHWMGRLNIGRKNVRF